MTTRNSKEIGGLRGQRRGGGGGRLNRKRGCLMEEKVWEEGARALRRKESGDENQDGREGRLKGVGQTRVEGGRMEGRG